MPPAKEYQIMRKDRLQTVSKAQYYRLKAQDDGASTRTAELQALLVSRAHNTTATVTSAAPIASSSASAGTSGTDMSVEPTREQSQSIQRDAMGMDLDQSAPEDQLYNDDDLYRQGDYADDLPDQPAAPPDPLQHEDPPIRGSTRASPW
ncbi:hypothetical protein DEU56DRAFT_753796 [Suillus clintonianus]|uniref:uncharacterized protein n=1 Tax=Suillus clintonianus TaxID=1904413 RepID=UPI001B872921|nr:uncharacterized protein DEU56DRAFT_753796 [Suillus clintonianus]KAG2146316.1 hypothetical protein DEU56DRAFT_753796 [Suillus clintonianus]